MAINRKIRNRLRLLLAGVGIYACLWLLTAVIGRPQIQREALRTLGFAQSSTDLSSIAPFDAGGTGYFESDVAKPPYHWCVSRAYAPFVIATRSGFHANEVARGESILYFWFFGYAKQIRGTMWIT